MPIPGEPACALCGASLIARAFRLVHVSGRAGELAKWRVVEDDVRGLELVEYRPFPVHTFASGRPKPGFKMQWHLRHLSEFRQEAEPRPTEVEIK
jgi:hypothetical protein